MSEPRSVGSVSVSIVPDASGWAAKAEATMLPQAAKLGEHIGKIMADEIARAIASGTRNVPIGPSREQSQRAGSDSAGSFADAFRAKLTAALRALPKIEIGAASTEADQKIRDLQVELAELNGKRIGIDLSDEEAIAKLDELRARLAEINANATSLQVRADTGAALAQLDKLRAEIDALTAGTRDVDVRVDDHGSAAAAAARVGAVGAAAGDSGGGVSILSSRLVSLGAAAILGADIAIPAILAIGAAAGGLLAGIGVLAGGLHGVPAALEASGKKPSGGGGGGGGGSDGIAAQQRQLSATQATRSAADELTQAERAQVDAEKALSDAREQAVRDLEEMDNKLRDNALNQQQAAIDLAEAQKTLAQSLAAPGANLPQYADDIAQSRLNVVTAQQKLNELTQQGTQLAKDDADAHKKGVDGSDAVVAARQKLADANYKLSEAQTNVTETALRNKLAEDAAAASMAAGAAGTDQFADAMAKLNPLQQQFVEFLITLKPLMAELGEASSQFLPGLEAGIQAALPAFPLVLAIVRSIADAMGTVFANIGKQFQTPEGREFLQFLQVELPKQIIFLGNLFIGLGKLFAGIWEAAGPLIDKFDGALLKVIDSDDKLARGGGLASFFNDLIPLVDPTFRALGGIGDLLTSAFEFLAPILPPVLDLIGQLAHSGADLLDALSPLAPVLGEMASDILPLLATFFEEIVNDGVAPLAKAFADDFGPLLPQIHDFLKQILDVIASLTVKLAQELIPIMPTLAQDFSDLLGAVSPLAKPLGEILADLIPMVKPMLQLATTIFPVLLPFVQLLGPAFKVLAVALQPLADLMKFTADQAQRLKDLIPSLPGFGDFKSGIGVLQNATGTGESIGGDINLSDFHPTHKATGGALNANQPYWVGDNPDGSLNATSELFAPKVDGTLFNQSQLASMSKSLGNGASRTNNFAIYDARDPVATAHETANIMARRGVA